LEQLGSAKILTKIDLRDVYNLVRVKEGDEWKTTFCTRYGHFEYSVMPFGLINAPAVFQHMMNDIFREYLNHFVVIYLNDILIYSKNEEEHEHHVRLVLEKLRERGLYAKHEKCLFHQSMVEFLGYIVSSDGISIVDWIALSLVWDMQCFLGFTNFYRLFIKNYSKIVIPLTHFTREEKFVWNEKAEEAFEALKKAFTSVPILVCRFFKTVFLESRCIRLCIGFNTLSIWQRWTTPSYYISLS
jgi:hypothetical protein